MVGILVFSMFSLAVLGMLARAADLSRRDAEINQVNQLCQGYLEETLMVARDPQGYQQLVSLSLRPARDPHFLYALDVEELHQGHETLGLKNLTVLLYHADPGNPSLPDLRRVRGGLATCLGTRVEAP